MKIWVLYLLITGGGSPATFTEHFTSFTECETHAVALKKQFPFTQYHLCMEKSDELPRL